MTGGDPARHGCFLGLTSLVGSRNSAVFPPAEAYRLKRDYGEEVNPDQGAVVSKPKHTSRPSGDFRFPLEGKWRSYLPEPKGHPFDFFTSNLEAAAVRFASRDIGQRLYGGEAHGPARGFPDT